MLSGLVTKPGQISLALRGRQAPEINGPLQQQVECEESHSRHLGPPLTHLGVEGPEVRVTATVANDTIPHRRRRRRSGARRRTLPFPVACRSIRRRSLSTSGLAAPVSRPEIDSHPTSLDASTPAPWVGLGRGRKAGIEVAADRYGRRIHTLRRRAQPDSRQAAIRRIFRAMSDKVHSDFHQCPICEGRREPLATIDARTRSIVVR